jgi:3-methyladenine DNA glycosylase AlkD
MTSRANSIITALYSQANPKNVEGMARYGIKSTNNVLGVSAKPLFALAKSIGTNQLLALELWQSGIYEARILAALIADPRQMKKRIMNAWVKDFDNWAICDGVCMHCFRDTPYGHELAAAWIQRKQEFIRRAGFTMIATLAVHDKKSDDAVFLKYLAEVKKYSTDERNFVKKAVNWSLRQIGKRNMKLHAAALKTAGEIQKINTSSAKWIAADAKRELLNPKVQKRIQTTEAKRKK